MDDLINLYLNLYLLSPVPSILLCFQRPRFFPFLCIFHRCCWCWRLSLTGRLQHALFSTFRTQNIGTVGNESLADQSSVAAGALEAVVVPVTVFEGDKTGAPDAC